MTTEPKNSSCQDCGRLYGDEHGFPDLIIPFWAWKQISSSGDDSGLLCPSCICKRLHEKGIRCEGAFMSGPILSVSYTTMNVLRRVENIELAVDGRNNRWAGICELSEEYDKNPSASLWAEVEKLFPLAPITDDDIAWANDELAKL